MLSPLGGTQASCGSLWRTGGSVKATAQDRSLLVSGVFLAMQAAVYKLTITQRYSRSHHGVMQSQSRNAESGNVKNG